MKSFLTPGRRERRISIATAAVSFGLGFCTGYIGPVREYVAQTCQRVSEYVSSETKGSSVGEVPISGSEVLTVEEQIDSTFRGFAQGEMCIDGTAYTATYHHALTNHVAIAKVYSDGQLGHIELSDVHGDRVFDFFGDHRSGWTHSSVRVGDITDDLDLRIIRAVEEDIGKIDTAEIREARERSLASILDRAGYTD